MIWEAQFGDFANGAQVVIDQFIASGEVKWGRVCGLTLLLPHGYEGQGPEHSSARPERFLQLCAEHNMQVCVPTTPAQIFHLLRRQMVREFRKPLIVMTPEEPAAPQGGGVAARRSCPTGRFHTVIGDAEKLARQERAPVVVCSGKVYYDLTDVPRARARSPTWPSSASSSCIRSRTPTSRRRSRNTRTRTRSSGARRSRRTRAPGTVCAPTCATTSSEKQLLGLRRPPDLGLACRRLRREAPGAAAAAGRRRVRAEAGVRRDDHRALMRQPLNR